MVFSKHLKQILSHNVQLGTNGQKHEGMSIFGQIESFNGIKKDNA